MKIIQKESIATVIHAWLRDEWTVHKYNIKYPELKAELIDNANLDDPKQNKKRRQLLRETRQRNIDELPTDTKWYSAELENKDYPRIHLIACDDWLPISGNSLELEAAVTNMDKSFPHTGYARKIYSALPNPKINTKLIMVGSDLASLITVIEGNHRAAAFEKYSSQNPGTPKLLKEIYLGLSLGMKDYLWHIESRDMNDPGQLRPALQRVNV
jgi:hypothetical protein